MEKIFVQTADRGIEKAKKILYRKAGQGTVLFLSGGNSPKPLYQSLALEKKLHPAAVAVVDERYGEPMHENSNELMFRRTGLLNYLRLEHIPFHGVLKKDTSREDTALQYDETVRNLFFNIPKSIAIVGIGADGHTAGIAPNREDFHNRVFANLTKLVDTFNDTKGPFKERITLTFQGLSLIDYFILWVFGDEKRAALERIFTPGSLEEIPGRFFNQPEISQKTVLISDLGL